MTSKYFLPRELKCKCNKKSCNAKDIDNNFLNILDNIRQQFGDPMKINSCLRCKYHNNMIGGSPKSQHLLGKAADIQMNNDDMYRFLNICLANGIKGIGIANGWLHIDIRDGEDKEWTY